MTSGEAERQKNPFQGINEKEYASYLGISYARAARFAKPELLPLPTKETEAKSFGPCCPQFRAYHDDKTLLPFYYQEFREGLSFSYDENCLSLNVYAPKTGGEHPVILFFHGGSYTRGSSNEKPMDGSAYAKRGVVFVNANYRLNIFGFGIKEDSPYNLALWDMLTAIHWVKANIALFGGDPNRLTLMGQSAGAMSIQALLYNPEITPLVQGAILMSGGGFRKGLFAPHSSHWIRRFCAHLPKGYEDFSSKDLFLAYEKQSQKDKGSLFAFSPCYDGELLKKKDHHKKALPPLIIGTVEKDLLSPLLHHQAKAFQRHSPSSVYCYDFVHPLPGGSKTNFHSCDLWYALGSLSRSWRGVPKEDEILIDTMLSYFTYFAENGNPNGIGVEPWAPRGVKVFH
jgi:carboxylesterase type B